MSDPASRREGEEEEEEEGQGLPVEEPDVESISLRELSSSSKLGSGGDSAAAATAATLASTSTAATTSASTSTAATPASTTSGAPRPSVLSVGLGDDDVTKNADESADVVNSGGGVGVGGSVGGGGGSGVGGSSERKLSPFEEWDISENAGELRKKSVAIQDAKEAAIFRLQEELHKSKETLKLRDVEVEKLSR